MNKNKFDLHTCKTFLISCFQYVTNTTEKVRNVNKIQIHSCFLIGNNDSSASATPPPTNVRGK